MVEISCPICKGTGMALSQKWYNRVGYFGDKVPEEEICWLCQGKGTVFQEPIKNTITLHKYWNDKEVENG